MIEEPKLRQAFVNPSRKELSDLILPSGFKTIDWGAPGYDPEIPRSRPL